MFQSGSLHRYNAVSIRGSRDGRLKRPNPWIPDLFVPFRWPSTYYYQPTQVVVPNFKMIVLLYIVNLVSIFAFIENNNGDLTPTDQKYF